MNLDKYLPLAAIASEACPQLSFEGLTTPCYDTPEYSSVTLLDTEKNRWQIIVPKTSSASQKSLIHGRMLANLSALGQPLPFHVPSPLKGTELAEHIVAIVHPAFEGTQISPELLEEDSEDSLRFARSFGHALGTLHSIPAPLMQRARLPHYTANQVSQVWRQALLGLQTIPTELKTRWNGQLSDSRLWSFTPALTHSNLQLENIYVKDGQLSAFADFSHAAYSDAARDLSWIYASCTPSNYEEFIQAYLQVCPQDPEILAERIALNSELNYVEWLCHEQRESNALGIQEALDAIFILHNALQEAGSYDLELPDTPGLA